MAVIIHANAVYLHDIEGNELPVEGKNNVVIEVETESRGVMDIITHETQGGLLSIISGDNFHLVPSLFKVFKGLLETVGVPTDMGKRLSKDL